MNLIEERLFFSCVYRTDLDIDLSDVKLLVKNLDYNPRPKGSGYQTRNFFPIEHSDFFILFSQIEKIVEAIANNWGIQRNLKLLNYWVNLDKRNDYSISHFHPEGIISGVFYIKVPKDSGRIIFERSDLQEHYFEADLINEYNYKN